MSATVLVCGRVFDGASVVALKAQRCIVVAFAASKTPATSIPRER
jgi:hypothetical protein